MHDPHHKPFQPPPLQACAAPTRRMPWKRAPHYLRSSVRQRNLGELTGGPSSDTAVAATQVDPRNQKIHAVERCLEPRGTTPASDLSWGACLNALSIVPHPPTSADLVTTGLLRRWSVPWACGSRGQALEQGTPQLDALLLVEHRLKAA
ncbi:unnamed protein product [Durusdinium trenchii]|uniref:Uncharacterized protein n=1 Tax=Durusdinium trenchii TaxID=1381693 RepID=A0ABP0M4Z5_9DINO